MWFVKISVSWLRKSLFQFNFCVGPEAWIYLNCFPVYVWDWLILWIPYFLLASGDCTSWPWGSYNYFFYFNVCIFSGAQKSESVTVGFLHTMSWWSRGAQYEEYKPTDLKRPSLGIFVSVLPCFPFCLAPLCLAGLVIWWHDRWACISAHVLMSPNCTHLTWSALQIWSGGCMPILTLCAK